MTSNATSAPSMSSRLDRESSAACSSRSSASSIESNRQLPHLAGGPGHGDPYRHGFTLPAASAGRCRAARHAAAVVGWSHAACRPADVTDPDAHALLAAYFAERAAGFRPSRARTARRGPTAGSSRRRPACSSSSTTRTAHAVGCGGVRRIQRRPRDVRGALRGEAPLARARGARAGRRAALLLDELERRAIELRRAGARARHEREPRGGRRAVPVGRVRRTSSPTTTTRTPRTGTASAGSVPPRVRAQSDRVGLGQAGAQLGRQVREVVVRHEAPRPPRLLRDARSARSCAWLIDIQRQSGAPKHLAHEPADHEVVGDEQVVAVFAVRAQELGDRVGHLGAAGLDLVLGAPSRRTARTPSASRASGPTGCSRTAGPTARGSGPASRSR